MGVGAVWLSPIFKSPMYDFGYDIADFYAVHDEFGTMEDFEELLIEAQKLGKPNILKVLESSFACIKEFLISVRLPHFW